MKSRNKGKCGGHLPERLAHHDAGRLVPHTRQGLQLIEGGGHLAPVLSHQDLQGSEDTALT